MTLRHQHHHDLIEERFAAWRALPRRSGLDKLRRREAGKRAVWTLIGHLQGEHGRRRSNLALQSVEQLEELHRRLHEEES